jgi:acylphosphatase
MDDLAANEVAEVRLEALVHGRVQGVGFRWFVREEALRLGLRGWVRNRRDGTVEVQVEGSRRDLDALLAALRRGPAGAEVTDVETCWLPGNGEAAGFRIQSGWHGGD